MSLIDVTPEARAAAIAAVEASAEPETPAETPAEAEATEQPAEAAEPAAERQRGPDGKFLTKREARDALAKALEKPGEQAELKLEKPEVEKPAEKVPTTGEVRKDLIALRREQAAIARQRAELEKLKSDAEHIQREKTRYAEAKKNPVAYMRELARETGLSFHELYEQATAELINDKTAKKPEPVSPDVQALRDEIAAMKREHYERAEQDAVARSTATFVTVVRAGAAEKYPLLADEPEADLKSAAIVHAQKFHAQNGRWPTHDEVAGALEQGLRTYYTSIAPKVAKLGGSAPAPAVADSSREPRVVQTTKPASPKTLSNGHAAQAASATREMTIAERRLAARRLLG